MIANATVRILHSSAGYAPELSSEQRKQEACVVCARKDWTQHRHRCYLWKVFPDTQPTDLAEDEVAEDVGSEDEGSRKPKSRELLRDADGVYYFGDAAVVNKFLGVEHYAKAMPRIPLEELHASSVQHPKHSSYRWLLHTRRAPTLQGSFPCDAHELVREYPTEEDQLPSCAGVVVEDSKVWLCKQCRDALCMKWDINMPGPALANLMWGGREHPA